MATQPFIIIGGGGHARVVADTLRRGGHSILGYTDPYSEASLSSDIEYLGEDEVLEEYGPQTVFLAIGIGSTQNSSHRADIFVEQKKSGFCFPKIVHPKAFVASGVFIGVGTQVMAGAIIQPGASIRENVIVNTNASIDHDCDIHDHVHVAPGVTISGEATIGEGVHVGAGASVIQGINIGAGSVVGAGAVVVKDVPAKTTVVGVPAKPIKKTS